MDSITDPLNRTTLFGWCTCGALTSITYTNTSGQPLNPATLSVSFTYDMNYNRAKTMVDGSGTTTYAYNPIANPPAIGAGQLASIDGPLTNDTIAFGYDQLGRMTSRSIN